MNRRDFELISGTVKRLAGDKNGGQSKETVAVALADAIEKAPGNHGFDRYKFLQRCGVAVQGVSDGGQ